MKGETLNQVEVKRTGHTTNDHWLYGLFRF